MVKFLKIVNKFASGGKSIFLNENYALYIIVLKNKKKENVKFFINSKNCKINA